MIDVTFTLTEEEFLEAQLLSARIRQPWAYRGRWLVGLILAALIAWMIYGYWLVWQQASSYNQQLGRPRIILSPWVTACDVLFILFLLYTLFNLLTLFSEKRRVKKLFQRSAHGHTNTNVKIDNDGWLDNTPGSSITQIHWSGFSNWIDGASTIVTRRPGLLLHVLPKRALSSAELVEARTLITNHLGPAVKIPKF